MVLGIHDGFKFNISLGLPVFPFSMNLYEYWLYFLKNVFLLLIISGWLLQCSKMCSITCVLLHYISSFWPYQVLLIYILSLLKMFLILGDSMPEKFFFSEYMLFLKMFVILHLSPLFISFILSSYFCINIFWRRFVTLLFKCSLSQVLGLCQTSPMPILYSKQDKFSCHLKGVWVWIWQQSVVSKIKCMPQTSHQS